MSVVTLFILTLGQDRKPGAFLRKLPAGFLHPAPEPYGWSYLVFTVFLVTVLSYNASWALVQKYNTLKSEKEIRKMIALDRRPDVRHAADLLSAGHRGPGPCCPASATPRKSTP